MARVCLQFIFVLPCKFCYHFSSSQSSSKSSQRSSSVHEIRQSSQSQSLTSLKAEDETKEENAKTKEVATKLGQFNSCISDVVNFEQ